jgi:hypothetical protein
MTANAKSTLPGWPGTYWEPTSDEGKRRCLHCGQDYAYHGAGEVITRRLGLKLNQQHLVCRPLNDINPDRLEKIVTVETV